VETNTNNDISAFMNNASEIASELTPISIKEAREVIGQPLQYESNEAIARAILDFTAIARSFFRNIPKYQV